ncbi:MAG: hypothetical protein AB7C91_08845 [Sphaerochaeta sp.]|uniref:hypothetical protein n=1 Tax=Sphaerochaeta sp. TaxID=1972642 RepID=UPI002FCC5F09
MHILEQQLVGKRGIAELCEDGIFCNEHFAAVVDGCTSRQGFDGIDEPGGVIAKRCILETLSFLRGDETYVQVFSALNASIFRWYAMHGLEQMASEHPNLRCSAYAAIVSRHHREVWVLGDCQARFEGVLLTRSKAIDTLMEGVRSLLIEHALATGYTKSMLLENPAIIQDRLKALMQLQPVFQNTKNRYTYSYSVLDGFFDAYAEIQIGKLPDTPVEVALASDGYPVLHPTLEQCEATLHAQLAEDPLMAFSHRATKPLIPGNLSFDDRSFLRILI